MPSFLSPIHINIEICVHCRMERPQGSLHSTPYIAGCDSCKLLIQKVSLSNISEKCHVSKRDSSCFTIHGFICMMMQVAGRVARGAEQEAAGCIVRIQYGYSVQLIQLTNDLRYRLK